MWLLPTVDPPVGVERRGGGEALVTDVAHVWTLPRVGARVAAEQAWAVKTLPAEVAREHLLAGLCRRRCWTELDHLADVVVVDGGGRRGAGGAVGAVGPVWGGEEGAGGGGGGGGRRGHAQRTELGK